ncbi:hypothetical protein J1605_014368 [Eschrichtius robustus]|uniref:Uncharacterized protein n=1 Tax=Eschrichtius robustus TaxID=9764 RepID=A0AB34GG16_ESCRO|nr:hypothetical protein J1605_014368 [Eschrichtius robustus]
MQRTRVRALVLEDPTCRGATGPLEETFVQVQAFQHCSKGSQVPALPNKKNLTQRQSSKNGESSSSNMPQFVHDFCGFEKVDKESKEIFSNLVTLSEKLEVDLQEGNFIELLAVQHKELTNEDLMELEAQRKDKERKEEEEVTEEPERFTMQEMARGFSLFEEALLVFEAQDANTEWYTKVAAAVQNAIQCYCVIYDEKKRAATQTSLNHFSKGVERIESSKEPEPVPSMSGVSEIAACPLSPIADDPSALPSPTSSLSSSQ